MYKLLFWVLAIVLFGTGFCNAEEFPLNRISDWEPLKHMVQSSDKTIRVFGRHTLFSKQIFPYDKSKSYKIMGEFKAVPGTKDNYVRVGIQPLDDDKKHLLYCNVRTVANSDTKLLADVNAGATSIMIADGSKWRINGRDVVVFHTDPEGKDLPNRNIIKQAPIKLLKKASGWEVVFAKPVGVNLKKGIGIRLHPTGGRYRWVGYGSSAQGLINLDCLPKLWDQGVKYFRIIVIANSKPLNSGDMRAILEMKNIRLEIK